MLDLAAFDTLDNWWLMWGVFLLLVPVLLIADLFIFHRKDHAISLEESLKMSGVYVGIGLLFGDPLPRGALIHQING